MERLSVSREGIAAPLSVLQGKTLSVINLSLEALCIAGAMKETKRFNPSNGVWGEVTAEVQELQR